MKILLNGVGRIGKAILRLSLEDDQIEIVAINEINPNRQSIAYSINYDSTYGTLHDKFVVQRGVLKNSTTAIEISNHTLLSEIDMSGIDIVIDASGSSVDIDMLRGLDVEYIFLTHPSKDVDISIVLGVNEDDLDREHHKIISTSSCNATALLPILKLIDDNYHVKCGDIVTIHPLLNHQRVLDSGCIGNADRGVECNLEFGRSATQNIIPSQTTTIEACSHIMPSMNATTISSSSLRVPTPTVGAIATTLFVKQFVTKDDVLDLCQEYEESQEYDILLNNSEPLVSSDFQSQRHTTIVDHRYSEVIQNSMIKLLIWYDNEWGYASKVLDIVKFTFK
ncbi:NAD-dependent glyceraldehyde-3-phosphate dehydrogenase [hydrothermal vent metagenome]|uniref:NAD-dependent glyceraldehyde-3-phosphate dehydrogenase n=1 Tax=hydrothermal vent metagenome TaxID=652676 RepID=A0A1W1BRY8_9ZZZZ